MDWELKMPPWDLSELDQATTEPNMGPIGPGGGLDCSVDLKLGGLGDFAAAAAAAAASSSSVSAAKRARQQRSGGGGSSSSSQNAAACSVDGCRADLSSCRDYHRRHKVCEAHSKTPIVVVGGQEQRFCQQCSRFHLLVEFDDVKRSCRKRLDGHNRRRRKPQSNHINSGNLFTNHHQGNNNSFSSYPHVYQAAVSDPTWPVNVKSEEESLFNHHTVQVHFLDRQQQQHRHHHFSNSFPLSFKEGKHFPFLQDSTDRATTVETSSICQPLLKTISSAESSNNNHNHNNTSNKFFADGLSRVLDSDCALSLLSSPPQSSSAINLGHTAAPSVDRIPICQPLISYGGGGLELGRYSGASNHVSVSATGFSYSGMEDENNVVGGSTTVLVSDASDPEMSCQELFGVVGCEGSSDGGSQTLPFSW